MKRILWTSLLTLALNLSARGGLYTYTFDSGFQNGGGIPNGSADGWSDTRSISGLSGTIQDVNVSINMSGGANGDLYAYLAFNNGSVVLLNRIGRTADDPFGSSTSGFGTSGSAFSFTFDDAAEFDIHGYSGGSPITGTYQPDGRTADPLVTVDTDARGAGLTSFNNASPNGNWTIFFADMSGGNDPSTVASWSLEIQVVPEPVTTALGIFAGILAVVGVARNPRVRNWIQRRRAGSISLSVHRRLLRDGACLGVRSVPPHPGPLP